mmetsp:Transcript_5492/g.7550  ORF Transcript_5492/g.7550 Transcript_5492/m.7550 type:complete len:459 (-) Transcript_5492:119-1495(-)|eukprot:CAMPEP_0117749266 /NCGR_PEP_ID=MMETSP0947-20121206/9628_1 /TAXON_ID=44440 /ORGANISM="Chattonella subsalsa, Strain CCMP2191" /LENGTH=458 /DNA_ID=CAMNT_0005567125 /DNA_START=211 /DNA_END=1587 /DNA_ORIENTATION=+
MHGPENTNVDELKQNESNDKKKLKEAAFQVAQELMSDSGIKLHKLTSREGIHYPITLRLCKYEEHVEVCWHEVIHAQKPMDGWDVGKLKAAIKGFDQKPDWNRLCLLKSASTVFTLVWPEIAVSFLARSEAERDAFVLCFQQLCAELTLLSDDQGAQSNQAINTSKSQSPLKEPSAMLKEFSKAHRNLLKVQEHAMDEMVALRWVYSFKLMDRFFLMKRSNDLAQGWKLWTEYIRNANRAKMETDRKQWHLHAQVSSGSDLHAWYHSVFCSEVYRLQGPFWFKPAKLSVYKCTNTPVGGAPLTPMEKAILASVMCTKGTTYVDVAVQMYTVQAILSESEFQLYQKLTSGEVELIKHAARTKPTKKKFRLSFVSGALYLTWEDKNGYKGIGLYEVLTIVAGMKSDDDSDLYLSLLLPDRSLDISFESLEQRHMWQGFLNTLVLKERGDAFEIRKDFKYS